jgi:hypothetical protein
LGKSPVLKQVILSNFYVFSGAFNNIVQFSLLKNITKALERTGPTPDFTIAPPDYIVAISTDNLKQQNYFTA